MVGRCSKLILCGGLVAASSLIVMAQNDTRPEKPPPNPGSADENLMQLGRRAREYWDKGDYTNALPLAEEGLKISELALGTDSPELAKQLILIGSIHSALGNQAKALFFFRRCLEIIDRVGGKAHERERITTLMNLGLLYRSQQSYGPATAVFERCLAAQEDLYGKESTNLVGSMDALAGLYKEQADYDKSLSLYRRGLEICQKSLGDEHPFVVIYLNNMARLCHNQGQ